MIKNERRLTTGWERSGYWYRNPHGVLEPSTFLVVQCDRCEARAENWDRQPTHIPLRAVVSTIDAMAAMAASGLSHSNPGEAV